MTATPPSSEQAFYLLSVESFYNATLLGPDELPLDAFAIHQGRLTPDAPLTVSGGDYGPRGDFVQTQYAGPIIVSDRVVNLLRDTNCTGWSVFSVTLLDRETQEPIPDYYALQVIGRCAGIDWSASKPVPLEIDSGTKRVALKGMHIVEWDGSDVFGPPETAHIFLSHRAAETLLGGQLAKLRLDALDDVVYPPGGAEWEHLQGRSWDELGPDELKPHKPSTA